MLEKLENEIKSNSFIQTYYDERVELVRVDVVLNLIKKYGKKLKKESEKIFDICESKTECYRKRCPNICSAKVRK